jgi:putative transcriptional regulator
MPYNPIEIDRKNLTIMGVSFPNLAVLESAANAIGSNMFEGFEPTQQLIEIYRDYRIGKIPKNKLLDLLKAVV